VIEPAAGQVVTVFRSRLAASDGPVHDEYEATADALLASAQEQRGFVDFKTFAAPDGERVSIITFADRGSHDAWRRDPTHVLGQRAGRERFYAEYQIQVRECVAVKRFERDAPQGELSS
jgi:heme-degrading monooxygenase HmoA